LFIVEDSTALTMKNAVLLSTLMTEAICSSKMSVLTRATGHHIPEYGILHQNVFLTLIIALRLHIVYKVEEYKFIIEKC
jgi:hypothetical protein